MYETLLRGNRRFGVLGLIVGGALTSVGIGLTCFGGQIALRGLGVANISVGVVTMFLWWQFLKQPRLAISDSELWVYIQVTKDPVRVPLEAVEVFFIGQGAVTGSVPGQTDEYKGAVAANVIVRIAERATEWHSKEVNQWLGIWQEGYITLRGLWCEDINQELLKKMNRKLLENKRRLRQLGEKT